MSPPYIFAINEIKEHPEIDPDKTAQGDWLPSYHPGYNYKSGGGISGAFWFCERTRIRSVLASSLPQPLNNYHYKTFSVFYSGGRGFWIFHGDATTPAPDQTWWPLRFEYGAADKSSYLTPAGTKETLECHQSNKQWTRMLLPDIYHGPRTLDTRHGGVRGELPIFLALCAMSMEPAMLQRWLPWMFSDSRWNAHPLPDGRTHKRGVVVNVYTCPATEEWAGGSDAHDLEQYERGIFGNYYY